MIMSVLGRIAALALVVGGCASGTDLDPGSGADQPAVVVPSIVANGPAQPTRSPAYAGYRSSHHDQLLVFQGNYRNLGATVDEIADALAPFDILSLASLDAAQGTLLLRAIRVRHPDAQIFGRGRSSSEVDAWRGLEGEGAQLDGIHVDHPSEATWAVEASHIHGLGYRIIANIGTYRSGASPIAFLAAQLKSRDVILADEFLLVGGKYETDDLDRMMAELTASYAERGIRWAVIASELGNLYVPPSHVSFREWNARGWITNGGCYDGPTDPLAQGSTCDFRYLLPPVFCGSSNQHLTYEIFRSWADRGGTGYAYAEARLGVFNGIIPFCPNDF
jgi:hypothetical protein